MVGRGSVAALVGAALLMLGTSATAFAQDESAHGDGHRALAGHDRGAGGQGLRRRLRRRAQRGGRLRRRRTTRRSCAPRATRSARRSRTRAHPGRQGPDRRRRPRPRRSRPRSPKNGLTKSAKAKGAVNLPGNVVIQRAYTFTNYAGRFLYVEAHNKDCTATPPARRCRSPTPARTARRRSTTCPTARISPTAATRRSAATRSRDTDAGAGARYMYHRGLVALLGANANLQATRSRCASRTPTGNFDTSDADRVDRQGPAAARRRLPEGLHLEVHGPDRDLQPDGPADRAVPGHHARPSTCPNKTAGYRRRRWR